jgi:hypothetical protein
MREKHKPISSVRTPKNKKKRKRKVFGIGLKLGVMNQLENGEFIAHVCLILAWPKKFKENAKSVFKIRAMTFLIQEVRLWKV